jgi:hypothetical protein
MRARILLTAVMIGTVVATTAPAAAQSDAVLAPPRTESDNARAQSLADGGSLPESPVDAVDGPVPLADLAIGSRAPIAGATGADTLQATPPPAQADDQPPSAPEPARAPRPSRRSAEVEVRVPPPASLSKWVNIRIDATVIESRGEQVTSKKVVSITLVDGENGSVRSSQQVPTKQSPSAMPIVQFREAPLNMDARARLRDDGRVHLWVTLEYFGGAPEPGKEAESGPIDQRIRESVTVVLESGKPLVVAQSADAVGDRRVALEVKATILK